MRSACLLFGLGFGLVLSSCGPGDARPLPAPDAYPSADAASDPDAARPGNEPPDNGLRDAGTLDQDAAQAGDGDDAGMQPERFASRRLTAAPSYMGSVNNSSACSQSYPTQGFEPVAEGGQRFPLFLYFVGTAFTATDASASYDSMAATKVSEAMARRGFVALSVGYDNGPFAWLSDHKGQLQCLFGAANSASLLAKACALPQVDCAQGIATWGHSLGGYVAAMAHNHEPRVRAVWTTGYGGDGAATLPKSRLRVVNGEADTGNGSAATLNMITGLTPAECPDPDRCLRADGSGWIVVRVSDLALPASSSADHCWFDKRSCADSAITLEPHWVDPSSTQDFALEANADWISATTRRL